MRRVPLTTVSQAQPSSRPPHFEGPPLAPQPAVVRERHRPAPVHVATAREFGDAGADTLSLDRIYDDAIDVRERVAGLTAFASALYKVSRPHTMLGSFVSVCSVSLLALVSASLLWLVW